MYCIHGRPHSNCILCEPSRDLIALAAAELEVAKLTAQVKDLKARLRYVRGEVSHWARSHWAREMTKDALDLRVKNWRGK